MRIEINESDRGPRFFIVDRPGDDEWIDITEFRDAGERLLGKNSGDILEVRQHERGGGCGPAQGGGELMPIRPENRGRYPADWRTISARIRFERAGSRCECAGECGLHRGRRCEEYHGEPARWANGKIVLTVAHLNHQPEDCRDENLKAMCQRCHLRYDVQHHKTSRLKEQGQGELPLEAPHA